jgi:hypothetical protein
VLVLGRDPVGKLVQVRFPDDGVAGLLEPADGLSCSLRYMVAEDGRPVRRDEARRVEEVLDGKPDPLRRRFRDREKRVEGVRCRRR